MKNVIYHRWFVAVAMLCVALLGACRSDKPANLEPQLHTLEATDISRTVATIAGQCQVEEGAVRPQLWFCYGEDERMEQKTDIVNADGTTNGRVQLQLTSLTPGTTYYYMLQGGSGKAVLNGERLSFTTLPNEKPVVGKVEVLGISPLSVIVGYTIADTGGDPVTQSGCYLLRQDNTAADDGWANATRVVQTDAPTADGMLRLRIGGLQPGATYTLRPFAVNKNGEAVGEGVTLVTSLATTISEAGQLTQLVGDDKYNYAAIAIAGTLNGDDLRTLRDMAGRDNEDHATNGQLADIDLSGAQIVEGGKAYAAGHYTQNNVVGTALFASCQKLRRIVLPLQTIRIEGDAFKDCSSLSTIIIPALVEKITPSSGCTALANISVAAGNSHYCSKDGVLLSADGSAILWFPMGKGGEYTLPATVTEVGDYAFRDCSIEKFVFAAGLKSIGKCTFYNSKVKEVSLPSTLKQVPTGLFQKCAHLATVHLGQATELLGEYVFDGCPLTNLYISAPTPPACTDKSFATSGTYLFSTCRIHVPEGRRIYYRGNATWAKFKIIKEDN